jgi:hypothetical protein
MAQITLTVPDDKVPLIVGSFTARYGTDPQYTGLSGAALVKAVLRTFVRNTVGEVESSVAAETARKARRTQVDQDTGGIS